MGSALAESCEYLADLSLAGGTRAELRQHMDNCLRCASLWSPSSGLAPDHLGGVAGSAMARRGRLGAGWLVGGLAAVLLLPLLSLPIPASRGHHPPSRPAFSHRVLPAAHAPALIAGSNHTMPGAATVPQHARAVEAAPASTLASAAPICLSCLASGLEAPFEAPGAEAPRTEAPPDEPEPVDERSPEPTPEEPGAPEAVPTATPAEV
jgi:hypothetical protein